MNSRRIFTFCFLGLQVPLISVGYAFHGGTGNGHGQYSGGTQHNVQYSVNYGSSGSHNSGGHSGGHTFSSSTNGHYNMAMPPHDGQPQDLGEPPQVYPYGGTLGHFPPFQGPSTPEVSTEPLGNTALSVLTEKSIVDAIVDGLPENLKADTKSDIIDCISECDYLAELFVDVDKFRDFMNWELTQSHCKAFPERCNVGFNVIPVSLLATSYGEFRDLPLEVNENDRKTYQMQRWAVTSMLEVACISNYRNNLNDFHEKLDKWAKQFDPEQVRYFIEAVEMTQAKEALRTKNHICFPKDDMDHVTMVVKDIANFLGIRCYVYSAMNQQVGSALPPEDRGDLRGPPTYDENSDDPPPSKK